MSDNEQQARETAEALHDREEREKAIAAALPEGKERDDHRMLGERLSDTAWSIEEELDGISRPSGLWPADTAAARSLNDQTPDSLTTALARLIWTRDALEAGQPIERAFQLDVHDLNAVIQYIEVTGELRGKRCWLADG